MSHHYSGPDCGFPHGDAAKSIFVVNAFERQGDARRCRVPLRLAYLVSVARPPHQDRAAELAVP
jgi:hypothetical protein